MKDVKGKEKKGIKYISKDRKNGTRPFRYLYQKLYYCCNSSKINDLDGKKRDMPGMVFFSEVAVIYPSMGGGCFTPCLHH